MYAERLMPRLDRAKDVEAIDMRSVDPTHKGRVGVAKVAAKSEIKLLREVLFLED